MAVRSRGSISLDFPTRSPRVETDELSHVTALPKKPPVFRYEAALSCGRSTHRSYKFTGCGRTKTRVQKQLFLFMCDIHQVQAVPAAKFCGARFNIGRIIADLPAGQA
jgi:hypothetical protein